MFESFFARFAQVIPKVKADDEDLIDPQQVLRKQLHEIRTQEKPTETPENKNPVDSQNNSDPVPVTNKNDPSYKSAKSNLENAKIINKKKIKSLACKSDKDQNGDGSGNGNGGSGGNGNGNGDNGDGDGDLIDPIDVLRDKCREKSQAVALQKKYEECNARVLSRSQTSETCVEELFDLLHEIDHCVTEKLFSQLK